MATEGVPYPSVFPLSKANTGLKKRELYAAMALQGLLAGRANGSPAEIARAAVEYGEVLEGELDAEEADEWSDTILPDLEEAILARAEAEEESASAEPRDPREEVRP